MSRWQPILFYRAQGLARYMQGIFQYRYQLEPLSDGDQLKHWQRLLPFQSDLREENHRLPQLRHLTPFAPAPIVRSFL